MHPVPILFNIYREHNMRRVTTDGWKVATQMILCCWKTTKTLLVILHKLETKRGKLGLDIKYSKTKVMIIDRVHNNNDISKNNAITKPYFGIVARLSSFLISSFQNS